MMGRFVLLTLLSATYIKDVSGFNPNVFWKRAKTIMNAPIIAMTNGGFYEGNQTNMYTQLPVPMPPPVVEEYKYSVGGLYEEYRKTLQQSDLVSDLEPYSPRNFANTVSGFYGGPKKTLGNKNAIVLYEPPSVVKLSPYLRGNRFAGSGFYQGP